MYKHYRSRLPLAFSLVLLLSGCSIFNAIIAEHDVRPTKAVRKKVKALTILPVSDTTHRLHLENLKDTFVIPLTKLDEYFLCFIKVNGVKLRTLIDFGDDGDFEIFPYAVARSNANLIKNVGFTTIDDTAAKKYVTSYGIVNKMQIEHGPVMDSVPFYMPNIDYTTKLFGVIPVYHDRAAMGMGFVSKFRAFTLDMGNKKLFLNEVPLKVINDPKTMQMPCKISDGVVYLDGAVDSIKTKFFLDLSGTPFDAITLYGETAKRIMKTHKCKEVGLEDTYMKTGDKQKLYSTTIAELKLGNLVRKNLEVGLRPDISMDECGIGDNFFGVSAIGIDQNKGILYYCLEDPKSILN
jgi:hypothetical protein